MKKLLSLACVVMVAVALIGCAGSASVKANPDFQFPLEVTETKPAFLFPISLTHIGSNGDPLAMGIAVSGGIANEYGKKVVSGQQLYDLVGNLSFELAERIQSQAQRDDWAMKGSAEATANDLANMMKTMMGALAELKLVDKGVAFKYIIALHSHGDSQSIPGLGKVIACNSWGGMYDIDSRKIVSYIETTSNIADDASGTAILAQLPKIYNDIIKNLIEGK